jgi:hypothetical protein
VRYGANHLARGLVLALALIRHLSQQIFLGPTQIGDFDDKLGLDPMHTRQFEWRPEPAIARRRCAERHASGLQGSKTAGQALELGDRDPGADAAGVPQSAIIGVVAEKQRADMWPTARRVRPTDDDEFFAVEALRLNPEPAIARRIWAVDPLGHGAFEAEPTRVLTKLRAVADDVFAEAEPRRVCRKQRFQTFLCVR